MFGPTDQVTCRKQRFSWQHGSAHNLHGRHLWKTCIELVQKFSTSGERYCASSVQVRCWAQRWHSYTLIACHWGTVHTCATTNETESCIMWLLFTNDICVHSKFCSGSKQQKQDEFSFYFHKYCTKNAVSKVPNILPAKYFHFQFISTLYNKKIFFPVLIWEMENKIFGPETYWRGTCRFYPQSVNGLHGYMTENTDHGLCNKRSNEIIFLLQ